MNLSGIPVRQKERPVRSKGMRHASGKDSAYLGRVARLPCVICHHWGLPQQSQTQVHHCIHGRYSQKKVPDLMTIPLCEGHHQGNFDTSKVAIHREPVRWRAEFGADTEWIAWTQDRCATGGQKPAVRGLCAAPSCIRREFANGYCASHYRRKLKYGDPLSGGTHLGAPMQWLRDNADHDGNDCLAWPFSKSVGYYSVKIDGGFSKAHRIMCELAHGAPFDGALALHGCGNKSCVNPRHLRWGTPTENSEDSLSHGTRIQGSKHPSSKLDEDSVRRLREEWREGNATLDDLAKKYPGSRSAIWLAATEKTWRHVK